MHGVTLGYMFWCCVSTAPPSMVWSPSSNNIIYSTNYTTTIIKYCLRILVLSTRYPYYYFTSTCTFTTIIGRGAPSDTQPYEPLHLFSMKTTTCGVKQGLWKCWFPLQKEVKTRWGDSKNEVGLKHFKTRLKRGHS